MRYSENRQAKTFRTVVIKSQVTEWLGRVRDEVSLYRHNKQNRKGVVSPDAQEIHVIKDALPQSTFNELLRQIDENSSGLVRSEVEWRTGSAIGGHELRQGPLWPLLKYLTNESFLNKVRSHTKIHQLQLVPSRDTNQISLLDYRGQPGDTDRVDTMNKEAAGDGISWHVDGSIYLGDRWAGILVLKEDTREENSKLELRPNGESLQLKKRDLINSLVLFRGDHVEHRVRPLNPSEHRVVLSLLFSPNPVMTKNPLLLRYQSRVNQIFYGDSAL